MTESQETPLLYIRADANSKMGTGHVMRCLALAQAWRKHCQGKVVFLSGLEGSALRQKLIGKGFEMIDIQHTHPHPDDLRQVLSTVGSPAEGEIWLALDGYHFDPEYQKAVRGSGTKLLVVDDNAHLPHYHCNLLLNQNLYADALSYTCDAETRLLLGTKYAMLREEFLGSRDEHRPVPEQARRILVTMGGADPDNVSGEVRSSLKLVALPDLEVKIVVGAANPHIEELRSGMEDIGFSCELLHAVDDMPSLMHWADLAISAGGSTCWELAYMGVPFLVIILADNQKKNAEALAGADAAVNLGWHDSLSEEKLAQTLHGVIGSKEQRSILVNNLKRLVDGKGVHRIVMEMVPPSLHLRKVSASDCQLLFRWANDPVVRKASFRPREISWEEHEEWFQGKLGDPSCLFYIVETSDREPVGQVRFDLVGTKAIISASICEQFRGLGMGGGLLRLACEKAITDKGGTMATIEALIKQENTPSQKAFQQAGFEMVSEISHCGVLAFVMHYVGK